MPGIQQQGGAGTGIPGGGAPQTGNPQTPPGSPGHDPMPAPAPEQPHQPTPMQDPPQQPAHDRRGAESDRQSAGESLVKARNPSPDQVVFDENKEGR